MADVTEVLKKLGLATARGVPQLATGFVDLAALPFTAAGLLKPEEAVGSTAYLTSKGLLPIEQKGLLGETTELLSSSLSPVGAAKAMGLLGATKISKDTIGSLRKAVANKALDDLSLSNVPLEPNIIENNNIIVKNLNKTAMLPSPSSLAMPSVPTVEQMKQYGRVETVPLSKAVSFQSARNWENFKAGKHPGDLVAGYGDKPLALRLETGEYVIYDGNHRTDLALQKGKTEMPMHVIDVKSYDPAHAGRKPVPPSMTTDELYNLLFEKKK
jgi:hypothetical protein